ncbi:PAS domain-containing protein [Jannaschia sp. S6380]|uniref:HWE histidine kinase domain-containing protein n=1 Tax=Jannaschia sp. S6380 TaxID=2926408 RepID=UPI001FF26E7C|nr:HWE histidine kinase domain-containing protein [Jannaschia sp. S6380]MCK0166486.1 PAS domain-containing protein [Jannaschia sp. S6380]
MNDTHDTGRSAPEDVFEAVAIPLVILDREHRIVDMNTRFRTMLSVPPEVIGRRMLDVFAETDERRARFERAYDRALRGETVVLDREYYRVQPGDGDDEGWEDRWWTVGVSPLDRRDGRHIVLVIEDRTSEVLAERMNETIASELQHRMANLASLIGVIAQQSARGATDVDAFGEALIARIEALTHATRILSGEQWTGAPVAELVSGALKPFESVLGNRVSIGGAAVALTAPAAQALTMGLHELATNAVKHGALSRSAGRLAIAWAPAENGGLDLEWRETGTGPTANPEHAGFGTTMLTRLLPTQLQGEAERTFTRDGMEYRLRIGPAMRAT